MRAARFDHYGDPDVLYIADVPTPKPGPGQVRIRVMAHAVNPIDWKVRSGTSPLVKQFPAGTGRDAAGVVDAVGEGVDPELIGRSVMGLCADGAAAEYCVLHHWADRPSAFSWAEAAAVPLAAETALRALRLADAEEGMTVLIDGASGAVGMATIHLAHYLGITVIGTCSPDNASLLRQAGAIPIGHGQWSPDELVAAGVYHVDRVLDYSGRSIPALIEVVGGQAARVIGIVDHANGPKLGILDSISSPATGAFDALDLAATLAERGEYPVRLGPTFPLERVGEAQQAVHDGAQGKVVIPIGASE